MSWINPDIQIINLENEITDIGEYVGYYWDLISPNGLNIVGINNNTYNISAPSTNNTQYAYSNIKRNDNWSITCEITNDNCDMYIGVSQNISQSFPSPYSPSMAMCDIGIILYLQGGGNAGYLLEEGQQKQEFMSLEVGTIINITYDGATIKFYENGALKYSQAITLSEVQLVCGSWYGGNLSNIRFTGSSSGGGGSTANLSEILANGNDGANQSILNINNLSLNGNLSVDKYINIGDGINNTSQLHFYYSTGNDSGNNYQIIANGGDDSLLFQYYPSGAPFRTPFEIRKDVNVMNQSLEIASGFMIETIEGDILSGGDLKLSANGNNDSSTFNLNATESATEPILNIQYEDKDNLLTQMVSMDVVKQIYTFGEQDIDVQNQVPTVQIQGMLNTVPFKSILLDANINTPQIYFVSQILNENTKTLNTGESTSIMMIDISNVGYYNLYNSVNTYINTLSFNSSVVNPNGFSVIANFFLSNVKDAPFNNTYPLNTSYTVALGGTSAEFPVSKSGIILGGYFTNDINQLYLNVNLTTTGTPVQVNFDSFNFNGFTSMSIMPFSNIIPTMVQ